jgi:hypothetical protein
MEEGRYEWVRWKRGSKCKNCVEVGRFGDRLLIRESRLPETIIPVIPGEFKSFIEAVKRGEFDEFCAED